MREIPLSQGRVALVDDEDYDRIAARRWHVTGRRTRPQYAVRRERKRTIWLHKEIIGAADDREVDHINRDPLDNRRSNLRICSRADNMRNRSYKRARPGYRGAYLEQRGWCARICVDGTTIRIGRFASEIEAAIAYDRAADRLHGEFAVLNFSKDRDWLLPYGVKRLDPRTPNRAKGGLRRLTE